MRIRQRLLLGFLGVVAIFVVFGGYVFTIWQSINIDVDDLDQLFEYTYEHALPELDATLHLALALETSRRALHEYLLGQDEVQPELLHSIEAFDSYYAALDENFQAELAAAQGAGDPLLLDELSAYRRGLDQIEAQHEHFRAHIEEIVQLTEGSEADEAVRLLTDEIEKEIVPVHAQLARFEESIEQHTEETAARFDSVIHAVEGKIRQTERIILWVLGGAVIVAFALGYQTAETISGPIRRLEEAALSVEAGTFQVDSLADVAARNDELGQFARTFERMASEIYKREQRLKEQIKVLQIKIDHSKQAEQVAEITDTDFFQDLRSRARAMRARKARNAPNKSADI